MGSVKRNCRGCVTSIQLPLAEPNRKPEANGTEFLQPLRVQPSRTQSRVRVESDLAGPGVAAHACNPSPLGSQGGQITTSRDPDHPGQHSETLSLLKIKLLAGLCGTHL